MIIEEIKKEKPRPRIGKFTRPLSNCYRLAYHNLFLADSPRVLCNSIMKSGTHLLVGIVSNMPALKNYGRKAFWFSQNRNRVNPQKNCTEQKVIHDLSPCLPGEISQGHIEASQEIAQFLLDYNFKHLFIYRDLRDMVLSHLFGAKARGIDTWVRRYFLSLNSDEERLAFLIKGWPEKTKVAGYPEKVDFPDVGKRFLAFYPWLNNDNCFTVKFEELIEGKTKVETLYRLAKFLQPSGEEEKIMASIESMKLGFDPRKSKTFRKGVSGEWRQHFTQAHVSMFKECAGDLLIKLGYETDLNWQ
jgi:hypothetical protein